MLVREKKREKDLKTATARAEEKNGCLQVWVE